MQHNFTQLPPLSLYVHIPWCVHKCPYCDFNSHSINGELPEHEYVSALLDDLKNEVALAQGRKLQSIFFGGGTPSLFSSTSIAQIITAAREQIGFEKDIEITLEANPGAIEQQKFAGFYAAGINRLSMGIQSFNDEHLQCLGRIHNSIEAKQAIMSALNAKFSNFNLDLMYGLPEQSVDSAINDLETAININPTHISWYQLTIEPNTYFYKYPPVLPIDETIYTMGNKGAELLTKNGYKQYEVSAWCKDEQYSKHNVNYWRFGDYLGIGAGAHSKITLMSSQQVTRNIKPKIPENYLKHPLSSGNSSVIVNTQDILGEFMINALRLNSGFSVNDFELATGLSIDICSKQIDKACTAGLLLQAPHIQPTAHGRQFLNNLMGYFI